MAPTNLFHSAVNTLWMRTIPRNPLVSTKILQNIRCSSGFASTVTPPRRFWDLHVPKTTWDYAQRVRFPMPRSRTKHAQRARDWVCLPDTNLPAPWTCDWAHWPLLLDRPPVEAVLPMQYAISDEPLLPIMFGHSRDGVDGRHVTIFACPRTTAFYLHRAPDSLGDPGYEAEEMWRFDGVFPSIAAFTETADWNRIEKIQADGDEDDETAVPSLSKNPDPKFLATDGRVATNQPCAQRTLWDMRRPPVSPPGSRREHTCTSRASFRSPAD
ncbi:hypothetical protein B0H17DRAFT_1095352 [Mycena rosella]|uniref:Uncharacterized protein n=1 Tax=Mycena rosella TaxID=1033263 RepID=A0AAD7CRM9_MYCRO|nr:hypothetical protein B0H17DRAFT_1095352 [Mycena rosella]